MDNAFERYKLLLKTYPQVEQHLSQYYIAAYLGIKPESLSRLKSLNIGQWTILFRLATFVNAIEI